MVSIVGWGHTKFGQLKHVGLEDLIVDVTQQALKNSGLDGAQIDAIYLGHFNSGLVPEAFASSLAMQADPALRFKPATRVENACASGSAAIFAAADAIDARRADVVLVIGAEKMTHLNTENITQSLAGAGYQGNEEERKLSFPGIFSILAQTYFEKYGTQMDVLARIAAKNHKNALKNPWAHIQKDLGFDFCNSVSDKNPIVADPLRLTDCSPISDGAAAVILVRDELAADFPQAARILARSHINDILPMGQRDIISMEAPRKAFNAAFNTAGIVATDLDFAEVHDCFTIAELLIYEAMSLTSRGNARKAIDDGIVASDGSLPINLSGGLKAKGHPVGATGVSMHVLGFLQLTNQAGEMQRPGASMGACCNMGGSLVSTYVSVLETVKA